MEHRTELEFSFYYDTVLLHSGLETPGELGGHLQVMKIQISEDGRLIVDFQTHAKFRGNCTYHCKGVMNSFNTCLFLLTLKKMFVSAIFNIYMWTTNVNLKILLKDFQVS